jgi:hypothetical protein
VSFGGTNLNLLEALKTIFVAGIVTYGAIDLKKLVEIFNLKITFDKPVEKDVVKVPVEDIITIDDIHEE